MTKKFCSLILDLVVEDFYGLWELVWRLKTCEPDFTRSEALRAAQIALGELYERGLVELHHGSGSDSTPIASGDAYSLLADEANWGEPSKESTVIFVGATPEGKEHYSKGLNPGQVP